MLHSSSRILGFLVSITAFSSATYLLLTGSSILVRPVYPGLEIPWGTPITWFGFLGIAGLLYFAFPVIQKPVTKTQVFLKGAWALSMILSVGWPFISYYLAANWTYSFGNQEEFRGSDRASYYFYYLCLATAVLPLMVLFGILLEKFCSRFHTLS